MEPYDNTVPRTDGTVQHFATMERPKFICENSCSPIQSSRALLKAECIAMLYAQQMPTQNIRCVQRICLTESPRFGIARTCATLVQHVVTAARASATKEETGRTPSHGNCVSKLNGSILPLTPGIKASLYAWCQRLDDVLRVRRSHTVSRLQRYTSIYSQCVSDAWRVQPRELFR